MNYPKAGDKTLSVKKLQLALVSKYGQTILPKFGADGGFGTETTAALKFLQQQEQLPVTGLIDDATWGKLFHEEAPAADHSGIISLAEATAWTTEQLESIAMKHIAWSRANNRFAGDPVLWKGAGELNVLGIRNNNESAFNKGAYNDLLICWMPGVKHVFEVTTDPGTVKDGRAHLRQGAWNSYVVRPHHHTDLFYEPIGKKRMRWAFCQDKHEVEVLRTDGKGNVKGHERGIFYINVHDCMRDGADTSIGCTVLKTMEAYCKVFVPMFMSIDDKHLLKNHDNLSYLLINAEQVVNYL